MVFVSEVSAGDEGEKIGGMEIVARLYAGILAMTKFWD